MKFSPLLWPTTSTAPDAVDEAGAAASCYFANGDLAEGYLACDAESPVSSCCPNDYTCSGNALCVLTNPSSSLEQPDLVPRTVSRGACTEPRWNGRYCGGKCLGKTARPPLAVLPSHPLRLSIRCAPRCGGGVAQKEQSSFLTCSATQTRKMRQGEQKTVTQSTAADGSGIVAQAVKRREAASARVTALPRWSLWERRERPRRSSAGGQRQPLFQKQLRIQSGLSKPGCITLPRRLLLRV